MTRHKITIKHVYQDINNPHLQEVLLNVDYALAFAFFTALIDKGCDFSVEKAGSGE